MMRMCSTGTRAIAVAYVVVVLSGCASHNNLVRCDGRLEPINMPIPRAAQSVVLPDSDSDETRSDRE